MLMPAPIVVSSPWICAFAKVELTLRKGDPFVVTLNTSPIDNIKNAFFIEDASKE